MSTTALVQNGLTRHRAGQFAEAEPLYRQALAEDPRDAEAWHLLGMLHYQRGRISLAIEHVEQAIRLESTIARFRSNLGIVYRAAGRLDDALASGREAVRLKPDVAEAHNSLGVTWQQVARGQPDIVGHPPEVGPWEQAVACFRAAVRLQPDYIDAAEQFGLSIVRVGRDGRSLGLVVDARSSWIRSTIRHGRTWQPSPTGKAGSTRRLEIYDQALCLQPQQCQRPLEFRSLALLATGNFREGWAEYAWRFKAIEEFRQRMFDEPVWDGSSLAGKTLLVWAEQGFGDTLQFIRYAQLLKRRGATVVSSSVRHRWRRCSRLAKGSTRSSFAVKRGRHSTSRFR